MTRAHGPLVVALLAASLAAGPLPEAARGQERVLVRRYADIVAVRARADGPEAVLYYFDPTRELPQGAQIQQGSSGYSELRLSGGGVVSAYASAQIVLERLGPEGDVLALPLLHLVEVVGGTRKLELVLPDGTRVVLLGSTLRIERLPGRLRIRNQLGDPVQVTGRIGVSPAPPGEEPPPPGEGRVLLSAGQEIQIPVYSGEEPGAGMTARRWLGRLVRHGPGAVLDDEGARLVVGRADAGVLSETALVEVGGVTTLPGPGRLVLTDPRPMALPGPPQGEVPLRDADLEPPASAEGPSPARDAPTEAPTDAPTDTDPSPAPEEDSP